MRESSERERRPAIIFRRRHLTLLRMDLLDHPLRCSSLRMTLRRRLQHLDILFVANEGKTKVNASIIRGERERRDER